MTKNLGLVVEGGGVRAMYAAGVLDVLHELHLPIGGLIGVSAGAIHGASFASGQRGRSLRFYKKFCKDDRFFSFKNFLKTGNLFIFRPLEPIPVGRLSHSPQKIQLAYNQGKLETQLRLNDFHDWLKSL